MKKRAIEILFLVLGVLCVAIFPIWALGYIFTGKDIASYLFNKGPK